MKYILTLTVFLLKASGLDLDLIVKIKLPDDVTVNNYAPQSQIISRKDGAFIVVGYFHSHFGIAVKPDRSYFYFRPIIENNSKTEKIISTGFENGKQFTLKETETIDDVSYINLDTIIKTISNKGVIIEEWVRKIRKKDSGKYYSDSTVSWLSYSDTDNRFLKFTKYNSNNVVVYSKEIIQDLSARKQNNFSDSLGPIIIPEFKDGYAYFYRLTDSDLLSSPNRITLGSSQNGSLTATVNNPEQALLNIQSSTNLIDWNTFKTIQNEPSLEVVIPANKPKELIRVTE
jgi:hypothetical protein